MISMILCREVTLELNRLQMSDYMTMTMPLKQVVNYPKMYMIPVTTLVSHVYRSCIWLMGVYSDTIVLNGVL